MSVRNTRSIDLRPRYSIFPLRIAPVLLINNYTRLGFRILSLYLYLIFTPTSHLYTYILSLYLHLLPRSTAYYTASTVSRISTTLPLLPRSSIFIILPQLPRAPAYYYTASRVLSAYLLHCLARLKRMPIILPNSISPGEKLFNRAVLIFFHFNRAFADY
jgi:hypothetical protein